MSCKRGREWLTVLLHYFQAWKMSKNCTVRLHISMGKFFDVNNKRSLKFQNLALESLWKVLEFLVWKSVRTLCQDKLYFSCYYISYQLILHYEHNATYKRKHMVVTGILVAWLHLKRRKALFSLKSAVFFYCPNKTSPFTITLLSQSSSIGQRKHFIFGTLVFVEQWFSVWQVRSKTLPW